MRRHPPHFLVPDELLAEAAEARRLQVRGIDPGENVVAAEPEPLTDNRMAHPRSPASEFYGVTSIKCLNAG